jgi:putative tricarboxylic transport membrane protein
MATQEERSQGDVQTRWVELVVALLVVAGGAVVVMDSLRVGVEWGEDGPRAGYFPFFIGLALIVAGGFIAIQALRRWGASAGQVFVRRDELKPVFQMLLPTIVYVVAIYFLGIYVSSAIYIAGFMLWQGKFKWFTTASAALGVPIALFLLFEIWFLVPLPKGPLERLLGY